jgi:hypothetical protein
MKLSFPLFLLLLLGGGNPATNNIIVSTVATANQNHCFIEHSELRTAVYQYIKQECATNPSCEIAQKYGYPMNSWRTSQITDMSQLFVYKYGDSGMIPFNENISDWDVSSVENMRSMFHATTFNGDISRWRVSKVVNMENMFLRARYFNGDISDWDTSSVVNLR